MSDFDDEPPPLIEHDEGNIDENDIDDDEEDQIMFNEDPCLDLFSEKIFKSAQECLDHCKSSYGFDIQVLKERHNLDCFSFIRLVNYLRKEKPLPELVMSEKSDKLWKKDDYLKPVDSNDPMLMYDIEEDENQDEDISGENKLTSGCEKNSSNQCGGVNDEEKFDEISSLKSLQKELDEMRVKAEFLEKALDDVENMRQITRNLINDENEKTDGKTVKDVASTIKASEDGGYAGSYAHFSIHHEMLSDSARTEAYRNAIYNNLHQMKDTNVLDLGCGTGILSMFCAKAGAKSVTGVDMSDIIHSTTDIIRENNFQDVITLVKGRLEDVEDLQDKKFDVLVSEWMGYFLLYEGMLDSVIAARDKYLSPGGLILPNDCFMHLFAISDEDRYAKTIDFWQDVYGFKMSCMKESVLIEASVEVVPKEKIASNLAEILHLDLTTCKVEDFAEFSSDFEFEVNCDCKITAIGGCFDTKFAQMENSVNLSTSPWSQPTHWKQTVFYLEKPISAKKGQILTGKVSVSRPPKDARGLLVKITVENQSMVYDMA